MKNTAIVEIAGRDSIAAALEAVRTRGFTQLVPTIAHTGMEVGEHDLPLRAVNLLRERLAHRCHVSEPVFLENVALWSSLNARFAAPIRKRHGMWSPCLACHLYLHLLRVPLAWDLGCCPVIAGERDTHDGRVKLSQLPRSIDASIAVLAYAGVELLQPIRSFTGLKISALAGSIGGQGLGQLGCALSGNYVELDGSVTYDERSLARYAVEYLEPAGMAVVDRWRSVQESHATVDYGAVVRSVLVSEPTATPGTGYG